MNSDLESRVVSIELEAQIGVFCVLINGDMDPSKTKVVVVNFLVKGWGLERSRHRLAFNKIYNFRIRLEES
jgi:hypothetical protein